ncbi:MAG TPA: PLP-dependent aminotransferase family protein [Pseudonocardiaceae bacterium]|nr:PLP-dependent aminotransferase family protein [Pseudonocardiaceae bacterium]
MANAQACPTTGSVVAFELSNLHSGVSDPRMDSMRLLSETALRYPKAISFASGRPYEGFFDIGKLHHYVDRFVEHLRERGLPEHRITKALFQYGPVNGLIRDMLARNLEVDEGIHVAPEAVMVTHGCQEAMMIALRGLFARPGDVLLTVSPCYVGIAGAAKMLDIPLAPVAEGAEGIDPDQVAAVAHQVRESARRPVACYVTPDFSNPSGSSLSLASRHRLLEVATEQDLLLLEDNPYGLFGRPGEQLPTLKALDTQRRVIYLGSFSKTIFPGARVGYLVADQEVTGGPGPARPLAEELAKVKSMFTVGTAGLSQAVVGGILLEAGFSLRKVTRELADLYVRHLEVALSSLAEHFPPDRLAEHGVRWTVPGGGFFLTVDVPFIADAEAAERSARDHGVGWAPMSMFYVNGGGERTIRLGFSPLSAGEIREGVRLLAKFIRATPSADR